MRIDIQRAALFGEQTTCFLKCSYQLVNLVPHHCPPHILSSTVPPTDSTFRTLSRRTPAEWKKNIQVQFINEQGVLESGIDGGGLFKEFIDILLKDMFSTPRSLPLKLPPPLPPSSQSSDQRRGGNDGDRDRDWDSDRSDSESDVRRNVIDLSGGHQVTASVSASGLSEGGDNKEDKKQILNLFLTTATGMLVPNPASLLLDSATSQGALQHYLFMGKMLGKAVYEEILVEPQFSGMFLNHLLGRTNFIDDLVTLDQEVSVREIGMVNCA